MTWSDENILLIIMSNQSIVQVHHIDGLVQERRNSSALAMELCLSYINQSIYDSQILTFQLMHWSYIFLALIKIK